jgi:hypothetical protein
MAACGRAHQADEPRADEQTVVAQRGKEELEPRQRGPRASTARQPRIGVDCFDPRGRLGSFPTAHDHDDVTNGHAGLDGASEPAGIGANTDGANVKSERFTAFGHRNMIEAELRPVVPTQRVPREAPPARRRSGQSR